MHAAVRAHTLPHTRSGIRGQHDREGHGFSRATKPSLMWL